MMDAEQYLSCDSLIARSTRLAFKPWPRTLKWKWIRVKIFGSASARSALSSTSQALILLAALSQDQHHVVSRAAAGTEQNHFHRSGAQIAAAAFRGAVHDDRMAAAGFGDKTHACLTLALGADLSSANPTYCAFHRACPDKLILQYYSRGPLGREFSCCTAPLQSL